MQAVTRIIATFFGIGYIPLVPATWASLVATIFSWYLSTNAIIGLCAVFTVLGLWVCASSRKVFHSEDPGPFVMDEVCGQMIAVMWLPKTVLLYAAAFVLFRVFDVWKPWLIGKIQDNKQPWSIMGDDLLAGVTANLILQAAIWVSGKV